MPSIDFQVYCGSCGEGLCNLTTVSDRYGVKVEVEPCPKCMESSKEDGYGEGYDKAKEESEEA